MVTGLDTFVRFFADFKGCYALIGGSACDLHFSAVALPFRATRDLDMVLCVEALTPGFFRRFWQFVRKGGYQRRERSAGPRQFYRFARPATPGFPAMTELFARKADVIPPDAEDHLTPIPADGEASSLSAILLDDLYYDFVMRNRTEVEGVSTLSPVALMMLKAVAWMDLSDKRARGDANAHARDIAKHKNDVARLSVLTAGLEPDIPDGIRDVMARFIERFSRESLNPASLGIGMTSAQILSELRRLFLQ